MKNQLKIAIVIGALLMILLVGWIAYQESGFRKSTVVGVGTFSQAIDYGPVYVARHFGWFEEALRQTGGGEVEYRELNGLDEIGMTLSQGRLQVLFSAEVPVVNLVSDSKPIRIVEIGCTLQQDVLVRKDKDRAINSISDLNCTFRDFLDATQPG